MAKTRIGILGGTFDPIHQGHIQMALRVLEAVHLDQMLIMPSGNPPYKSCSTQPEDRWKMVVAACSRDARLIPSRLEMDRSGSVYTIDTLLALHREYPKAELFYVIGADAAMKLHHWHRVNELLPLAAFLVCPRGSSFETDAFQDEIARLRAAGASIRVLRMPPVDISSTVIRASLRRGDPTPLLDGAVREFCAAKGLYGMARRIEASDRWLDQLFAALTPKRFAHSLSVARTARRLAFQYGVDPLQAEEAGLQAIAGTGAIGTVRVLGIGTDPGGFSFLLLEFVTPGKKNRDYWERLGAELYAMHRAPMPSDNSENKKNEFGFGTDNFIGSRRQKNTWTDEWIPFFRDCRLRPQLKAAERWLDQRDRKLADSLLDHLDQYLIEPDAPSLIHGDLWAGNVMTGSDGRAWIIDPAAYYGHPEADLAMTELFGGYIQPLSSAEPPEPVRSFLSFLSGEDTQEIWQNMRL